MQIRKYNAGDELKILDLFLKSFGKPLSFDFWKWRYLDNPFTTTRMINLMWDDDTLAGHYALFPIEMEISNDVSMAALSMTTMTNPEYTGKGIFKNLADDLYSNISNENVVFVWGFPNLNSHYGFNKNLSWRDIGTIPTLRLKEKKFSSIKPEPYTIFNEFTQAHADKVKIYKTGEISVNKTLNYLKWRYTDNPVNKYFIIGSENKSDINFAVIKIFNSFEMPGRQEIDILEHGYNPDSSKAIISSIHQFTTDLKADICAINTWMPIQDPRHIQLEKLNFIFDNPITIIGYRQLNDKFLSSSLSEWSLTMGDSDIY
jgi:hypothetical protein